MRTPRPAAHGVGGDAGGPEQRWYTPWMSDRPSHTAQRRRVTALRWAVAALLLVAVVGCRPPADRTSTGATATGDVSVELLTRPARVGPAAIEVRVRRDDAPASGATVRITGDMTHAGMVPVLADAPEVEAGTYRSDGFAFDMAGDWILTVDVTYPDGVRDQGTLAVSVAR